MPALPAGCVLLESHLQAHHGHTKRVLGTNKHGHTPVDQSKSGRYSTLLRVNNVFRATLVLLQFSGILLVQSYSTNIFILAGNDPIDRFRGVSLMAAAAPDLERAHRIGHGVGDNPARPHVFDFNDVRNIEPTELD